MSLPYYILMRESRGFTAACDKQTFMKELRRLMNETPFLLPSIIRMFMVLQLFVLKHHCFAFVIDPERVGHIPG